MAVFFSISLLPTQKSPCRWLLDKYFVDPWRSVPHVGGREDERGDLLVPGTRNMEFMSMSLVVNNLPANGVNTGGGCPANAHDPGVCLFNGSFDKVLNFVCETQGGTIVNGNLK